MVSRKKQLVIVCNVIALLVVTALAGYALYKINDRSLPISSTLAAISIALPTLTGVTVETVRATNRKYQQREGRQFVSTQVPIFLLTILETVLITLAGTHVAPAGGLRCGLEGQWQQLFHGKNEKRIRAIQDAYQCCGLNSVRDRAWPFPDKAHPVTACHETFSRDKSCYEPWKGEEQHIAVILMAVHILVFAWQLIVVTAPPEEHSWLGRIGPRHLLANDTERTSQRTIEYQPTEERYRDDPEEATQDDTHNDVQGTIEELDSAANEDFNRVSLSKRQSKKESQTQVRSTHTDEGSSEQNVWR